MRLAGTCRRYSNRATNQLNIAATYHARPRRSRKWAYQAMVMNTFENVSSTIVVSRVRTLPLLSNGRARGNTHARGRSIERSRLTPRRGPHHLVVGPTCSEGVIASVRIEAPPQRAAGW